jgi:hypothetical protein
MSDAKLSIKNNLSLVGVDIELDDIELVKDIGKYKSQFIVEIDEVSLPEYINDYDGASVEITNPEDSFEGVENKTKIISYNKGIATVIQVSKY